MLGVVIIHSHQEAHGIAYLQWNFVRSFSNKERKVSDIPPEGAWGIECIFCVCTCVCRSYCQSYLPACPKHIQQLAKLHPVGHDGMVGLHTWESRRWRRGRDGGRFWFWQRTWPHTATAKTIFSQLIHNSDVVIIQSPSFVLFVDIHAPPNHCFLSHFLFCIFAFVNSVHSSSLHGQSWSWITRLEKMNGSTRCSNSTKAYLSQQAS